MCRGRGAVAAGWPLAGLRRRCGVGAAALGCARAGGPGTAAL